MSALVQGSDEWLEMRRTMVGASDAPVIMEVSPWKTPLELWEEKLIPKKREMHSWMKRGLDLEEKARIAFEEETGIFVMPDVLFHPSHKWMMASLDGISIDKQHIVEIKCPGRDDHMLARNGEIPEKYYPQLQHQMEVSNVDMAYYYSFDGNDGILLTIDRNNKYINKMIAKEIEFWECLQEFTMPKSTQRDYQMKHDDMWTNTASQWLSTTKQINDLEQKEKELRDTLISMSLKKNSIGGGVKVSKTVRKGSVDYSRIKELETVNLENYRKDPLEIWKITSI